MIQKQMDKSLVPIAPAMEAKKGKKMSMLPNSLKIKQLKMSPFHWLKIKIHPSHVEENIKETRLAIYVKHVHSPNGTPKTEIIYIRVSFVLRIYWRMLVLVTFLPPTSIFFDTYGEYYEDLREFHQHLPKLLKPDGVYSFFNGLCGDNAFFHMVYCQLVALELAHLGFLTQFVPLPVKDCLQEKVWEGVKHKYWQLDTYYLPVCQSSSDSG
ncbi:hypothetical protein AMTRI_Chr12g269270 [Amborella trichopoda]